MADRGLVAKEQCDSDRRGAYVVVTTHGRSEIEAAAPGHVAAVRRLFVDRLTPDQLDADRRRRREPCSPPSTEPRAP